MKLTVSRALSDEIEARERSLASVKRAREKENKIQNKDLQDQLAPQAPGLPAASSQPTILGPFVAPVQAFTQPAEFISRSN